MYMIKTGRTNKCIGLAAKRLTEMRRCLSPGEESLPKALTLVQAIRTVMIARAVKRGERSDFTSTPGGH